MIGKLGQISTHFILDTDIVLSQVRLGSTFGVLTLPSVQSSPRGVGC
jgi:hypothetical protein